jgi:Ras-related protein Rab-21
MYYRGALSALLVYDVTNVESFEEVKGWAEELRSNVETNLIVVVVGNKIDLAKHRVVTERQGKAFADGIGALFFETSARENVGIDPLFLEVCKKLLVVSRDAVNDSQVVRPGTTPTAQQSSSGCPC